MDLKSYLADFNSQLVPYLETFFDTKIASSQKLDPRFVDIYSYLKEYILGGKKIRGALVKLGFEMYQGKNTDLVLPTATAVELIHSGLLIQDDWIDRDEKRRSLVAAHLKFSPEIAIIMGDLAFFEAYKMLGNSPVIESLSGYLVNTGYGQILDISGGNPDIVHLYKTAYYSFVMPLMVGAKLAQAQPENLKNIQEYGTNVGLAFQIRDDILNITGDPKITGKPILSDIISQKKTLIWNYAQEKQAFDPKNDSPDRIKNKFIACGAIDFAYQQANDYSQKAKKFTQNPILLELADFVISRDK